MGKDKKFFLSIVMYVKMVQGETHSSDSDVASEFYFSDVALYFDFFSSYAPPLFLPTAGRGTIIVLVIYYIHVPSRYSNIE